MNILVLLDNDPRKRGEYFNITCCQFQLFRAAISYNVFCVAGIHSMFW